MFIKETARGMRLFHNYSRSRVLNTKPAAQKEEQPLMKYKIEQKTKKEPLLDVVATTRTTLNPMVFVSPLLNKYQNHC